MRVMILVLTFLSLALQAETREITFDDLYGLPRCEDPRISPDGEHIVFELRTADWEEESRVKRLWMMDADGGQARQITFGPGDDWHPRWTADGGGLLFLSSRGDDDQIYLLPMEGGEARRITSISTSVTEFEPSPDGEGLFFVSRVFPECPHDSCNASRLAEQSENPDRPRLYDHLLFRHYKTWDDGRVQRLFRCDLDGENLRPLRKLPYDMPTVYLGGYQDFAVAPDGREVCVSLCIDPSPAVAVNNDLYLFTLADSQMSRLTDGAGLETSPSFSPDGRYLLYQSQERAGYESDQRELILYDRVEGTHRNLTGSFDRSPGECLWGPDGRYVYFTAIEHGFNKIWRLDIRTLEIDELLGSAVYDNPRLSPDGRFMVAGRSLAHEPYELYRFNLRSEQFTRLTRFTEEITDELDMRPARDFWFRGAKGDSVHGFLTVPPEFDPDERYPLVVLIHGGPQWCWLGDFNYYGWNTQLMAAQGYVVVQINPHGSIGYGLAFKEYISGNWGRGDLEDLMKGVDHLLREYPFIDGSRMAALGRSYGGFLVNWICGHTDRFRCLICIDGSANQLSEYGSTEELWFPEWEFKGTPWDNWKEYVRASPIAYAKDFKTPTMVIHGQRDYRVDLSEGLQMFTALQRMGVPSQLLYFPNEGHSVGQLDNLRYVYEKQFEWLRRWLEPSK